MQAFAAPFRALLARRKALIAFISSSLNNFCQEMVRQIQKAPERKVTRLTFSMIACTKANGTHLESVGTSIDIQKRAIAIILQSYTVRSTEASGRYSSRSPLEDNYDEFSGSKLVHVLTSVESLKCVIHTCVDLTQTTQTEYSAALVKPVDELLHTQYPQYYT
jgi:hypothetical protein